MRLNAIRITLLAIALSAASCARAQLTDAANITATLELIAASPACNLTPGDALDYAQAERPADASATGTITIDPTATTDVLTVTSVVPHGTPAVGGAMVSGSNLTSWTVTVPSAFASTTIGAAPDDLSFAGTWAGGSAAAGPFTQVTGTSHTGSAGGDGTTTSHHFRFGGTIGDITQAKALGVYEVTFQVSLTCS